MRLSLFIIALLLFITCTRELEPTLPGDGSAFGFYFLQDSSLTLHDVLDKKLDDLTPRAKPWLSANDIEFYDFSSHCIYLKKSKWALFPQYRNEFELFRAMPYKPFWVMANNEKAYIATFHAALSSVGRYLPYIDETSFSFYPADVLPIGKVWHSHDERNNETVKHALQNDGLYHAGISVELTDVSIVDNNDIATLDYSFSITNNDIDDLLILDADKMGPERFHYFSNGPVLENSQSQRMYQSSFKGVIAPEPYDSWDPAWFSILKSGDMRSWTVRLKGYEKIEPGEYSCHFNFFHPTRIEKSERFVDSARYWLGEINSNEIVVEFQAQHVQ